MKKNKYKRYLVFSSRLHEELGGLDDVVKDFNNLEKARTFVSSISNDKTWVYIFDCSKRIICEK